MSELDIIQSTEEKILSELRVISDTLDRTSYHEELAMIKEVLETQKREQDFHYIKLSEIGVSLTRLNFLCYLVAILFAANWVNEKYSIISF